MSGDKRCNMTVDSKFLKVSHITIMYKRVSKQLLNLNHSKATGFDGLKYRLLKEFIKEIVPILTKKKFSKNLYVLEPYPTIGKQHVLSQNI
jgi:hypothetical protein